MFDIRATEKALYKQKSQHIWSSNNINKKPHYGFTASIAMSFGLHTCRSEGVLCEVNFIVGQCTHPGNLQQIPELFLSLHLHLHDCRLCCLDALHRALQLREQINDALFTHQYGAVEDQRDKNKMTFFPEVV